jgi:hypothetical protein
VLPGGCFVFDTRHAAAVLKEGMHARFDEVSDGDLRVLRFITPSVDRRRMAVSSVHRMLALRNGAVVDDFSERHEMRLRTPSSMRARLLQAGFVDVRIRPYGSLRGRTTPRAWSLVVAARVP